MKVRLCIRGYGDGHLIFKERVEADEEDIRRIGEEHTKMLGRFERGMIEIEFLDELDPHQRFYRVGNDPSMMVNPRRSKL